MKESGRANVCDRVESRRDPSSDSLTLRWILGAVLAGLLAVSPALAQQVDLAVTLAAAPSSQVSAAAALQWAATVQNLDPGTDAQSPRLVITLPSGVTCQGVNAPLPWACSESSLVVSCDAATLAAGTSVTITVDTLAPADPAPGGETLTGSAAVSAATGDPDPSNDTDTASVTVLPSSDLSVAAVLAPDPVTAAQPLDLEITLDNGGPSTARDLQVGVPLPAGVAYTGFTGDGFACTVAGGAVNCTGGDLAALQSVILTLHLTAPDEGGMVSTTVTAGTSTDDPDASNDSAAVSAVVEPSADLAVSLSAAPEPVDAAASLTYTAQVDNAGPSTATGLTLDLALDPGLAYAGFAGAGWSCSEAGGTVSCTGPDLAGGASSQLEVTATAPVDGGSVTSTVTVASSVADPDGSNDSDSAVSTVRAVADLSVGVDDGLTSAMPGETWLDLVVTVNNGGPSGVAGAEVRVPLPAGLVSAAWTCTVPTGTGTCGAAGGGGGIATTVDLDAGSGAVLHLRALVAQDAAGAPCGAGDCLELAASVAAPSGVGDPDHSNDAASDADTALARQADLAVSKDDGLSQVLSGQAYRYTIRVDNPGPSRIAGVGVADVFPPVLAGHPEDCAADPSRPCWTCVPAPGLRAQEREEENQGNPQVAGMEGAAGVAVSPDGRFVFVAGAVDDAVVSFARETSHGGGDFGSLSYVGLAMGLQGAGALAVSPDGLHLYAAAAGESSVVALGVDQATGALTELGRWTDGAAGVSGIGGAAAVAVSPDGLLVVVAGETGDALALFQRDPASGLLTFAGELAGDAAVLLDGVNAVAFSPDGAFLYATAPGDGAVTVLSVDRVTPALGFVASTTDPSLAGVSGLAVSPDGAHLAAAGSGTDTVVTFVRDPGSGTLTLFERWQDGVAGVTGLDGVSGVVFTPDGRDLLAVAPGAAAVAVFERSADSGAPDFGRLSFSGSFGRTDLGLATWDSPGALAVTPGGRHVLVTDPVHSTLDVLATAFDVSCPQASGSGDLAASVDLPAGSFLTYTAAVALDPSASGTVSNTATLTPPAGVDPNPANDSATDTDTVMVATDLAADLDDGVTVATPGEVLETTLTVSNDGTVAAPGSTVTFDPPVYDGGAVTAGYTAGTVTWSCVATGGACCQAAPPCGVPEAPVTGTGAIAQLVNLPAAGGLTFTMRGTVDPAATGTLVQQATVVPPASVAEVDPADNTATDGDTELQPQPDLQVMKAHGPLSGGPPADWLANWTVTVHNRGPSRAEAAAVHDTFPPEVTSATWDCTITAGSGLCHDATGSGDIDTVVDLDPGATATFQIVAQIPAATPPGVVQNTAVASVAGDPDAGNSRWTDELQVGVTADLSADLTDGLSTATPGEDLTYVLTVQNAGPTDVTGARVTTDLPGALGNVTWTCSSETPVPGNLTFLEKDGWAGATEGASGVAVSPDGGMVYVAAPLADALAVFQRESTPGTAFGRLTFVEAEVDGHDDVGDAGVEVDGMEGASAVAVSPDGSAIYVAGSGEDAVAVFHYDPESGTVSFVEAERNGVDDPGDSGAAVTGIAAASDLEVSPDGTSLYVAGTGDDAVAVFDVAGATGRLSHRQSLTSGSIGGTGLASPSAVAVSPDARWVVVTGEGDDTLSLFSRSAATGELTLADVEQEGVDDPSDPAGPVGSMHGPSDVAFSPDGGFVYVASPVDDAVVLFSLDETHGELAFAAAFAGTGSGPSGVSSLALAADGEHLVAGQRGQDRLLVYRRQPASGTLALQEIHAQGVGTPPVDGLTGVAAVAVTPDGLNVLAAGSGDDAVAVFHREGPQPETPQIEVEQDGQEDPGDPGVTVDGLFGAWPVLVSGDGGHVYVGGYGDDAVAIFARNAGAGLTPATRGQHLVYRGELVNGGGGLLALDGPVAMAPSPDPVSRDLYVACRDAGSVVVLRRDTDPLSPTYGSLSLLQEVVDGSAGVEGLAGASAVAVEPGGTRVYVAGQYAASIAVFDRAVDGTLSFVGRLHDGAGGISGLSEVSALAISADGAHLYAAAAQADDVLVFQLEPGQMPRLVQTVDAGLVPEGLDEPLGMAFSPDAASSHLYLACRASDSLVVLERDGDPASATYGWLHPLEVHSGDGEGLHGVRAVAVSPDGETVYAAGEYGNDMAVFHRDAEADSGSFGALTLSEVRRRTDRNVGGLEQPYGLAVSPDSRNVYAASLGDGTLAAFVKRSGSACSASGVGEVDDLADLSLGGTATYTIRGTIDPRATGTLTAVGSVVIPDQAVDPDPSNNSSTDTTDLVPVTSLSVTKDDGRLTVGAGTGVTYTVTVANRGPSQAAAATVTDLPPAADFENVAWTCDATGSGRLEQLQLLEGPGFGGAADVALLPDPDGGGPLTAAAVAVSVRDDSLLLLGREPSSGTLTVLQRLSDGGTAGGLPVDGLDGARAVTASADGWFVYVGSQVDDAVAVFRRDPGTGLLIPVDLERDGFSGVDGLDRVQGVLLSADGAFLYAAGANDGAVAVFARNAATGELTFLEVEKDGVGDPGDPGGTVTGLAGAAGLALSPGAGDHLYVAASVSGTVAVFERDSATGLLSFLESKGSESTEGLAGASSVAVTPDGSRVLAAGRHDDAVVVFDRVDNPASPGYGTLSPLQVLRNGEGGVHDMAGPLALLQAPGGRHLWVAAHRSGSVVLLTTVDAAGRLGFLDATSGPGLAGASGLALSETGTALYSAAGIGSAVGVWAVGQESSCPPSGSGGISAVPVSVAAGGSVVFTMTATVRSDASGAPCPDDPTVGCVTNTATVASADDPDPSDDSASDTDALTRRADLAISKTDHHAVVEGLADAQDVAVTPDGRFLYVAGGNGDAIAVFARETDPGSADFGRPTFQGAVKNGDGGLSVLDGVEALVVSPDGAHLYAAAADAGAVAVFTIDPDDGSLHYLERVANNVNGAAGLAGASALAISRDGRFLYVAGSHENSIAILGREADPSSDDFGRLSPVGVVVEGQAGVSGLVGVRALAVTDDGGSLYAVAPAGTVAAFTRAPDGTLQQVQVLTEGQDGVSGLGGASDVVVSSDGGFVYVAGSDPGSVAVFSRDAGAGTLSFQSSVSASDAGVDGLDGARGLALNPDGEGFLYAAAARAGAVVVFARDPGSGGLTFLERWVSGDPAGTSGLGGAVALVLSDDGEHLYAVAPGDQALAWFHRGTAAHQPPPEGRLAFAGSIAEGSGGVAAGSTLEYLITVENLGPADAHGVRVEDSFPPELTGVAWSCSGEDGGACPASGVGAIDTLVDIPAGGRVLFTGGGMIRPGFSGMLSNTATVATATEPPGTVDTNTDNNTATDSDTRVVPGADLALAMAGPPTAVPGAALPFTVTVSNLGTGQASGALVALDLPPELSGLHWTCEAQPAPGQLGLVQSVLPVTAPQDAVVSPDGAFVYVSGTALNGRAGIAVLRRDPSNGTLTAVEVVSDGESQDTDGDGNPDTAVDGIRGITALALSPDGRFLFAAGTGEDAVAWFERDSEAGTLLFGGVARSGVAGVRELGDVADLVPSPGGSILYAASPADGAVVALAVDASGALSFAGSAGISSGVTALDGARALAVSADGRFLYAAAAATSSVVVLEERGAGDLQLVQALADGDEPSGSGGPQVRGIGGASGVALSPDGSRVWVTGGTSGGVARFGRDGSTGRLEFQASVVNGDVQGSSVVAGLAGAMAPVPSSDGLELYVAGRDDGSVVLLREDLAEPLQVVAVYSAGTGVPGLNAVSGLALGPEDYQLYAAGGAGGALDVLAVAPGSTCPESGTGLGATVDLAPGGTAVFTASATIAATARGTLHPEGRVDPAAGTGDPDPSNNSASLDVLLAPQAELAVTKDDGRTTVTAGTATGYTITVINSGPSDAEGVQLADLPPVYPADPAGLVDGSVTWTCTGRGPLAVVDALDVGAGAASVAIRRDGRFVYAALPSQDAVAVIARDVAPGSPAWGALGPVTVIHQGDSLGGEPVDGLAGAASVVTSADGGFLYVAGETAGTVAVFSLDPATGMPSPLQVVTAADASGLDGARFLLLSPDGRFLYAAGGAADAVVVFERAGDGTLTWASRVRDGFDGFPLNSLVGVRGLALSPDGDFLYAASQDAGAITAMRRDPDTGELSFASTVQEGDAQGSGLPVVEGLGLVQQLAVTPDGGLLVATALAGDAVTVFERDGATGGLTEVQALTDGDPGVDWLDGATALAVSPDGSEVWVGARNDDAVWVLVRDWATSTLRPLGGLGGPGAGAGGVDGPVALALAPDGAQFVAAGLDGGILAALERIPRGACGTASGTGDVSEVLDLEAGAAVTLTVDGTVHPSARGTLSNTATVTPPAGFTDDPSDDTATDDTMVTVETGLTVAKSDGEDTAVAGLPVIYQILVTNAGPSDALGATVADVVSAGLSGVTWTCTPGAGASCSASGAGDISDTVNIPVGGSVSYRLRGVVDPGLTGELANTATVAAPADGSDPDPSDNASTDVDAVVPVADLWVTKSDGVDEVVPGTAVTWTIVVGNDGPSDGAGTVSDVLPGVVSGATWSCAPGPGATCSASGSGSISDAVTIPAGSSVTYTVTGTVSPAATGSMANTAAVTVAEGISDPNLLNNTATDTDALTPEADLSIAKVDAQDPVGLGGQIVYTVTVTNLGPSDAQGVQVTDTLPAGVTLVGTTGCAEDAGGVPVCTLGPLGAGSSVAYTITVSADPGTEGTVTNTATVNSATGDPNPGNDTAGEDTLVTRLADLGLDKTDSVDPVIQGGTLLYTLTVSNAGPNDATDVVVTDTLPAGVTLELTQGCQEDPGGAPTCTVGSVPAGGSRQVVIAVTVNAPAGTVLTNSAAVSASSMDLDPSDDTAGEDTTVAPGTDLVVTKSNGVDLLGTGLPVTYTIRVENRGPADAGTVHVNDALPPELVDATWTCTASGGAVCSASGSGDLVDTASIPAGDSVTYTLTATVDPAITDPGQVVNTVTVAADGLADPNPADNTATDADPLQVGRYFSDGFETGDTSRWSGSQGKRKR